MTQFVLFYHTMHSFLADLAFDHFDLSKFGISSKISARFYSSYPDVLKKLPKYAFTRDYHWINIPQDYCEKPEEIEKYLEDNKNVGLLKGLDYFSENKSDNSSRDLGFLLHFLQDSLEPLHVIDYHRGGNGIHGTINDGQKVSLHQVFDDILPNYYIQNRKTDHGSYEDFKEVSMEQVIKKTFLLACGFRLEEGFYLNIEDYYNDKNLEDMYNGLMVDYLNMLYKYLNTRVK